MKQVDRDSKASNWRHDSRPLRFSACLVLLFGTVVGGFVLVQWGFVVGIADDFVHGRAYGVTDFTEPGAEIGIGIILVAVLITWLVLRKAYSKRSPE